MAAKVAIARLTSSVISWTVIVPVDVVQLRPSPLTSSPAWVASPALVVVGGTRRQGAAGLAASCGHEVVRTAVVRGDRQVVSSPVAVTATFLNTRL